MIGDTMIRLNRLADAVSYYQTARATRDRRRCPENVATAKSLT